MKENYRCDAKRNGVFTFITGYFSLGNSALAIRTRGKKLILILDILRSRWFSNDCLDLLAILRVDLSPILGTHQHSGEIESRVLQARPMAFYYGRS